MRWLLLIPCVLLQDSDRRYEELKRKLFETSVQELAATSRGYSRLKDAELAQVAASIAAILAHDPATVEIPAMTGVFRTSPAGLKDITRRVLDRVRRLQSFNRDRNSLETIAGLLEEIESVVHILRAVNDYRASAQLGPVSVWPQLIRGCMLHCRYMAKQGAFGASERKTSRFRTTEGSAAGRASLLASVEGVEGIVTHFFGGFYNRVPLLNPGLQSIGIGLWRARTRWYVAVDVRQGVRAVPGCVLWPVPDQKKVPRELESDRPNPLPGRQGKVGYPITLSCYGPEVKALDESEGRLEDQWGGEVETYFSNPANPVNARRRDNLGAACLIPKKPLKPRTFYRAVFRTGTQVRDTSFITGN